MDTVTRAAMAIVLAEEGGIGVIDRGFRAGDIEPQVAEVAAVKRTQHGVIADPHTIGRTRRSPRRVRLMERTGVGTLAVVDAAASADGTADRARRALRAGGRRVVCRAHDAARRARRCTRVRSRWPTPSA